MTKTPNYRKFIKLFANFKHSDEVMAKIKEHNPAYTLVTTSGTWESEFERAVKAKAVGFRVGTAQNRNRVLYDISQTTGRKLPTLYGNISGKAAHYQAMLDCLTGLSPMPIVFQSGASYYSGTGQDSFIQEGKIIIRPALSEQQIIFALVREIIRLSQSSAVVVEASSYMVCRHLNIDTEIFSFGYLLELMGYDESLPPLRDTAIQKTIEAEAEVFIGYLNANLPFLQGGTADGDNPDDEVIEPEVKPKNSAAPADTPQKQQTSSTAAKTELSHNVEIHTERVNDIDFKFMQIIREYRNTMPDNSVTIEAVKEYGYYDTKMLPIGAKVANRLLSEGREIYKLLKNSTEERIFTLDEIKNHNGYFGISEDEWATVQLQMLKDGVKGVTGGISRWGRVISPAAVEDEKKLRLAKERAQAQRLSEEKTAKQAEQIPDDEVFAVDGNGFVVISDDDIGYNDIEDSKWLETALHVFIKQTKFLPRNMPYFVNRKGYPKITQDMRKINSLMGYYCAAFITAALDRYKTAATESSNAKYNVQKAVDHVCRVYGERHIVRALDINRADIKVPRPIKMAFEKCFEQTRNTRKKLGIKPKRESPDERIQRVTSTAEAKENAQSADGQSENTDTKAVSEHNAEIYNIIESYIKGKPDKPTKPVDEIPILPPMHTTAKGTR